MAEVAARPFSFRARDDLVQGMRVAPYRRYMIFFTSAGDTVTVVRVLHGARDLPRLFEG